MYCIEILIKLNLLSIYENVLEITLIYKGDLI